MGRPNSEQDFFRFVNKTYSCWWWTGCVLKPDGYGVIKICGKRIKAHRLSYSIHFGVMPPPEVLVCHKCDNKLCVNLDHFFLGTQADNSRDRNEKGRQAFGERDGRAVITEEIAKKLREEFRPYKATRQSLADKYGISIHIVDAVVYGKSWGHLC